MELVCGLWTLSLLWEPDALRKNRGMDAFRKTRWSYVHKEEFLWFIWSLHSSCRVSMEWRKVFNVCHLLLLFFFRLISLFFFLFTIIRRVFPSFLFRIAGHRLITAAHSDRPGTVLESAIRLLTDSIFPCIICSLHRSFPDLIAGGSLDRITRSIGSD